MEFPPILILVIIWLLIGLANRMKTAKQQGTRIPGTGAARSGAKNARQAEPQKPAAPQPAAEHQRPTVMQPSITITEHDDSVYQGSMNAITGEGYDPCHDEQLASLTSAETAMPAAETAEPGLQLEWTGNVIVRGFVMSEILKRK